MDEVLDIAPPKEPDQQPPIGDGTPQPPPKLLLSDKDRQRLDSIVSQMVANKEKDQDIQAVVEDFKKKYATPPQGATPPAAATPPAVPEHHVIHTPIQDIRHLHDLANQPMRQQVVDPQGGLTEANSEDVARNKGFQQQYEKNIEGLAGTWGIDPKHARQALEDFPDEMDENQLKNYATLYKDNPVNYARLKNANDIRMEVARSGQPGAVNDANVLNTAFSPKADANYQDLGHNIAIAQEIMQKHGLYSQAYEEKLKSVYSPLINTLQPGLLVDFFNSDYHKAGLSESQYAGLETEKFFNPDKYKQDIAIIRQNKGLDQPGATEVPQGKEGYAYDRGVENILYQLENQGRQNTQQFVSQRSAIVRPQIEALTKKYQDLINNTTDPAEQRRLYAEYHADPLLQEAAKLDDQQQQLDYSRTEDQRRFPLNYGDQAQRLVKDAMGTVSGWGGVAGKEVFLGAGQSADNTMRFFKNLYINMLGSEELQAKNAAANIGHQSLTELANYEGSTYSMQQAPLIVDPKVEAMMEAIANNGNLSDEEKNKQSVELLLAYPDAIKLNPRAGQQNLTGKAMIYSAANTMGQILGIADQSMLMGGLLGSASKGAQMANALVPMYASTQNQLYEQALARGDEKPLLRSHLDAAIISLASLINPDIKVVKGMIGAETGIGKMLAGVEESTWNKVLTTNKPLVDRMIAGTKATARQLGLANLQYGLIVPTAQYLVHKNVLNEDPNLGDALKDGLIQTNISMAIPALLHGVVGGFDATKVNPMQKLAIVEAGLHPKENIELIDQLVQKGQITPDRADQIKDVIKKTGEIIQQSEWVKSDDQLMNEKEAADLTFQLLRKKMLEGKLKNAPDPQKPAIEEQIHQINQQVAELHTAEGHEQKTELNQLLTENLARIRENIPAMESKVRDAVKRNEPEAILREIYEHATETKTVDGKEVSSRPEAEATFGKELVQKAMDLYGTKKAPATPEMAAAVEKPSEGAVAKTPGEAEPAASSFIKPVSDIIQPTDEFRTWNLGDMEGKPEDEAAKKHIEGVVQAWDRHPAGETGGETFGSFVKRVIPAFQNALETDANNTTIVTHSSVLKAIRVWEEMGRPDIENLSTEQKKEFADKYNAAETQNGDLETFKGAHGDIHVIRHGQTEDNAKNNFRSGNTNLTEKGVQDAKNVGQELNDKTGGDVPKIITSDLPRSIHTSNLIHDALQESSPSRVLQHPQEGVGSQGGERGGMEPGQQGENAPGEAGGEREGQEPPGGAGGGQVVAGEEEEGKPVGPSHDALTALALRLGLTEPERGTVLTPHEYAARGRIMIIGGADPEKVARTFKRTGNVNPDVISVARAHLEDLTKAADKAGDQFGHDSEEFKAAKEALQKWQDEVVKPMGTRAGETFTSLQGVRDIDTGSFTSMQRNFYELHGRELTEKQAARIKELSGNVKALEKQVGDLTEKLSEAHDKQADTAQKNAGPGFKKKASDLAQKLRDNAKLNRPGMFSAATPASLVWDGAVEVVAKAIQAGGLLADAIAKGIDHIKESDWYKGLSDPDKQKAEDQFSDWHTEQADKKTAARIKALEKQVSDLQEGKTKNENTPREKTAREKELEDQIADLKNKMGLVRSKATPTAKPEIPQRSLAERMTYKGKDDHSFSPEEARDIWAYVKDNYLSKGKLLGDALRGTSTDLGLTAEQILSAIATPKGGKELTTEMWKKQHEYNKASEFAKRFVETADQSAPKKFWNSLPSRFFTLKTYGHGTVGNITHAATNIFRPSVWSAYWPNVIKSFSLAYGKTADYEKAITLLESRPNFAEWKRAGLAVDPREAYDDYQVFGRPEKKTVAGKAFQFLGEAGTKGFNGLKFMRYDLAEKWYNQASETERADPKFREEIAKLANHATGHSEVKVGKVIKVITFAPGLEVSRWQRMITDPAKAANTLLHWSKATPAEQAAAKIVASGAGQRLAIYSAALAANAGLLAVVGSKQKLNLTDPSKSDWLKFKMEGHTLDITGGVLGPLRLLHTIGTEAYKASFGDKKDMRVKPNDKDASKLWQQLRYKEAPLPADITDLATGQDAMGNVLPWANVPPAKGRKQLGYGQYALGVLAPIPVAAGFNSYWDAMDKQDVPHNRIKAIFDGVLTGTIEGFAGAKYEPDFSLDEKPAGRTGRTGGHSR